MAREGAGVNGAVCSCDCCGVPIEGRAIGPHVVGRCRSCSSLLLLSTSAFVQAYEQASGHIYDSLLHPLRVRQAEQHARWLETATRGRRLLDVGAGRGAFVKMARSRGWDACGVERDADSVAAAETPFVTTADLDAFPAESFDVVTLFDVLEHVWDRRVFLEQILRVMAPGALLMVRVPNAMEAVTRLKYEADARLGSASSASFFGEHKIYFSRTGLRRLLESMGLRFIDAWYEHETLAVTAFTGLAGAAARVVLSVLRRLEYVAKPLRTEIVLVCAKADATCSNG